MRGYFGLTDRNWFTYLRDHHQGGEVNFWRPSGKNNFRAIPPGAPLLFKLKSPYNAIGGFGYLSHASNIPAWMAWDAFGTANGSADRRTFLESLEKYRTDPSDHLGNYTIGCLFLIDATFFSDDELIPQPASWNRSIVQGKTYDLATGEGKRIFDLCLQVRRSRFPAGVGGESHTSDQPRFGAPTTVKPRLGQGSFKVAVSDAYSGACAVSEEHSLPALEAGHIRPYSEGGEHSLSNGLLLRSDIHRLFDKGYLTVTPEFRVEVSPRLKSEFKNGRSYYGYHGSKIHLPKNPNDFPSSEILEWHNQEKYLG